MLSRAQAAADSRHRQLLSLLAVALKSRLVKGVPLFVAAVRGEPLHLGDEILCHKSCDNGTHVGEDPILLDCIAFVQYWDVTDRRANRRMDTFAIAVMRYSMLSRVKTMSLYRTTLEILALS